MKKRILLFWLWLILLPACSLNTPGVGDSQSVDLTGAPVVTLVSPAPNNTYLEGIGVTITASISNAGPDIASVEFAIDDVVIASVETPNEAGTAVFSVTQRWTAEGEGEHTASVVAIRGDGTRSEPTTVTFSVMSQEEPTEEPTDTPAPTRTQEPDEESSASTTGGGTTGGSTTGGGSTGGTTGGSQQPSATPAPTNTSAPSVPTLTVGAQGVNVRRGPSTLFNPPLGGLAAGQTAEILAVNPARDWYKIRYFNADGWVFAGLVTITGDISTLPTDQGPPVPTAAPPTAIPPTATVGTTTGGTTGSTTGGGSGANLVPNAPSLSQAPFCGVGYTISVNIVNNGNQPTATGFFVIARVTAAGSTTPDFEVNTAVSAVIQPGANFVAQLPSITPVRVGGQTYTVTILIDLNNQVPESNDNDNTSTTTYVLGGTCQ